MSLCAGDRLVFRSGRNCSDLLKSINMQAVTILIGSKELNINPG
jgi:hypothetical protein